MTAATRLLCLLAAALLLSLPAAYNGLPFIYPDTATYIRGAEMGVQKLVGAERLPAWVPDERATKAPASAAGQPLSPAVDTDDIKAQGSVSSVADKVVLAGRSVYYGMLLYVSFLAGSLWLTVLVHGLCAAYVLHVLMVRLWGLRERTFLGTVAALTLLTPLGVFTGFLMPDIFTGLVILCTGTLTVYWTRLSRPSRWMLGAILLFGLASHASHLPLAAALLLLAWGARRFAHRPIATPALAVVAGCLVAALAAEAAFNLAVTRFVGAPPLRLPHLTARLIDMGPGTDYLRSRCPTERWAACRFVANYPTRWDAFLFSPEPSKGAFALADSATKRRMSEEQLGLAWAVFRHAPVTVARGVAQDVVRQVFLFDVDVAGSGTDHLPMFVGRMPDRLIEDMRAMRFFDTHAAHEFWSATTYASTFAAVVLLAVFARRRVPLQSPGEASSQAFTTFTLLVLAGVLLNAVLCATLASPLERFQSRVIWLVPWIGMTWLALAWQHGALRRIKKAPVAAPLSIS
ncbi:hypothetical protein [Ramlibacter rhizophilus]|uniref:Glycosyltransferase RgtA/B/C/D-like domain-containing protein n=1 Tax=Ramlibacter rhizophilus TaxID=1781167 RepID=A0A4Z0C126_9BURK|nr:hypothetical protein [Ramlibacter rhizophilus]TFZ04921.1 hypothetical protein EZ242_04015 [Ramlibacter rhizophilus]